MDAQTFLDNFGTIAEAPDGPQRLRDLVLELAVRGHLLQEDDGGGTSSACSDTSGGTTPVGPFDIPARWLWTRVGEITDSRLGKMLDKAKNTGPLRPYLRNANVQWFRFELSDIHELRLEDDDLDSYTVQPGDLIICEGGEPGRLAICNEDVADMVIQKALHRVRPLGGVDSWYLAYVLQSFARSGFLATFFTGATIKHLTGKALASVPVPLPPLAEQERIVANVGELMELCNDLEARQERRHDAATLFRSSSLHALSEAETSDQILPAWQRADANWALLTDEPSCTQPLQETIVDLAVRGHLSRRHSTDRDARIDLDEARARKRQVPGLRKQPAIDAGTPTTVLPDGWAWATVDDLFLVAGGIQKSPKRRPKDHHFPYLRVANVQRGKLDLTELERFELADGELERLRLEPGDLLVVEGNGSESEIGRCARWNGEIPNCVHQNHLIRCRPMLPGIEHYLLLFLNSPLGMETMKDLAVTTSGLYNLSVSKIRAITFPMPPIAEQKRIGAEVDELLRLLEKLAESLQAREEVGAALSIAATAALTH